MAKTRPFVLGFERMIRDMPRHLLPPGGVWNLVDYLPRFGGAAARKRGGWAYASPDISVVRPGATRIEHVYHAPFAAASKLVAIDQAGELYTVASSVSATDIGAVGFVPGGYAFHRDLLVMALEANAPKKFNGTVIAALGGTPPSAAHVTVYKDRTVLGRTAANTNRVWFSAAGNPESWDTTNAYIDTTWPITALGTIKNAILVFSNDRIEKIRGAIPPPATDMVLEPLFDQGTVSYRSLASYGDSIIFANPTGVWMTEGATLLDLTKAGGISQYWQQDLMSNYTNNWVLAGGVYRGYYILVASDYPGTFKDCLVCDIEQRVWFRFANLGALRFAHSQGSTAEELYVASFVYPRVLSLSSIFSPSATVKNDADGIAVVPIAETAFLPIGTRKRLKNIYVDHDIRDAASDAPILTVSYLTSPEATVYTNLTPTLAKTTALARVRIPVGQVANGFAFKIAQTNASSETRLYELELEGHELEQSRR